MAASYDYLFLTLGRAPTPHQALAERLRNGAGADLVGQFAPQLGWANNEAAVLLRRQDGASGSIDLEPPLVARAAARRLSPTVRPNDSDRPRPGGIYVHRWFEVEAAAVDEFIALSSEGWRSFETEYDARIFGLFRAEPAATDDVAIASLLLITRYGDHGVWEASRDPTKSAMQVFARRQRLTRRTWAASSLLLAG